ncbi:hypothetical protein COLO4_36187 [Corchorus olitorius]|uniref:Uncharacterized protein n=1 Tax=Corchorus olitorius TaxID=93759 RepID=A0A1R3GAK0_9ROSI|nr:hypothetical protein COLO4_36187 [Corchorus olitorius]
MVYTKLPSNFKFLHQNNDTNRLPRFNFINVPFAQTVQSCSGLLLCVSKHEDVFNYFICNPVTKQLKMIHIPLREQFYPKYKDIANSLGVDPTKPALVMEYNQVAIVNLAFDPIIKRSFHQSVNLAFDALKSPHY